MSVFVDTNVLLRSIHRGHSESDVAIRATRSLLAQNEALVVTPQILAEFWNVITRPADRNGFGRSIGEAQAELPRLESMFAILPETSDVYREWKHLVIKYQVSGVQVHDARLVAAMIVHNVPTILSFNTADLARYREVRTIEPSQLVP